MYATVFDKNYMSRGIAMALSLLRKSPSSRLSILCLDLESEIGVVSLLPRDSIEILRTTDVGIDLLISLRQDREYREYCWTLGAVLCEFLLTRGMNEVVYLDADIFFFGNPDLPLNEARHGDVAAIEHRFPDRLRQFEVNGRFNVQWVYFRNTEAGRAIASRWSAQCKSSCKYDPENGIVGDQKYLDEWPMICPTFVAISHCGSGVAPWNHETHHPRNENGTWRVGNGDELVFYHFHGLRVDPLGEVTLAGSIYSQEQPLPLDLYSDYIKELKTIESRVTHLTDLPNPASWKVVTPSLLSRLRRGTSRLIAR